MWPALPGRMLDRLFCRFAALAALALTACAPSLPRAPTALTDDPSFAQPAPRNVPGIDVDPALPFVVLPGDILSARVTSIETVETPNLVVTPDGSLSLPLGGRIAAAGKSLTEVEALAQAELSRLDHFARLSLAVTDAAGHRCTIVGAVEHPGTVALKGDLRFADAIAMVGGTRTRDADSQAIDLADLDGAHLIRDGKALPVSLARAMEGDPRHNVRLRAGDHVFVPPSRGHTISILGSVRTARVVPATTGMRLSTALALAGGPAREANEGDVRVVRGPLSAPRVYRASLRGLVGGTERDVELAPGDVVYVSEHWFATTTDVIAKITPALFGVTLAASLAR